MVKQEVAESRREEVRRFYTKIGKERRHTPGNKRNNVTTRINIGENACLKRNMKRNVTFRET